MPRTPLFRTLQRSLRLARLAAETGRPADEVVEIVRESPGLTRRQLLGGTAAAAGLALVGCRPFAPPLPRQARSGDGLRVVIVGAGIAGLTAGYRLQQKGASVRVFEGQDRIGGRMYSQRGFFPEGQVAELGGELIDTTHVRIRQLAEELAIPLDDFVFDDLSLDLDVPFFAGRRLTETEVMRAFVPVSRRMAWDRATLAGGWVSYREPNGGERLDRMPLSQWLDGAGAEPWLRKLLDVAYTTEYGLETAEQSALNFLLLMDPNPLPFRIFGESDERFHVRGGNDLIPKTLAERLGDRVETGTRVEAVSRRPDGSCAVSVRRGGSSETVAADHQPDPALARPRLSGRRGRAPARQAVPLPLADLRLEPRELHLLQDRAVDRLRRRGGPQGGEPPLRRRAHLGVRAGVHGRGMRVRGEGGEGDPGDRGESRAPGAAAACGLRALGATLPDSACAARLERRTLWIRGGRSASKGGRRRIRGASSASRGATSASKGEHARFGAADPRRKAWGARSGTGGAVSAAPSGHRLNAPPDPPVHHRRSI